MTKIINRHYLKKRIADTQYLLKYLKRWRMVLRNWQTVEKISSTEFKHALIFLSDHGLIDWAEAFLDLGGLAGVVTNGGPDPDEVYEIIQNYNNIIFNSEEEPRTRFFGTEEPRGKLTVIKKKIEEQPIINDDEDLKECLTITNVAIKGLEHWQATLKAWLKADEVEEIEFEVAFIRMCRCGGVELTNYWWQELYQAIIGQTIDAEWLHNVSLLFLPNWVDKEVFY